MNNAPPQVTELIERFDQHLQDYCSSDYKEAQLRAEFIDPFFRALSWDMSNEKGYAEAYKDVVYEDTIKIGKATKAPDYCFRILQISFPSIKSNNYPSYSHPKSYFNRTTNACRISPTNVVFT